MANTIIFELVSPEKLLISRPVDMITMPGAEGYFGVLPGHAPLIAALQAGVIEVKEDGKVSERLFVSGGFAEVSGERCTVLAQDAVPVAELDKATIEAEIAALVQETPATVVNPKLVTARAKLNAAKTAA